MKFVLVEDGVVVRTMDNDPVNLFVQELAALWQRVDAPVADVVQVGWLWDGKAFVAPPPPPPLPPVVPEEITMRQARLVLLGAGMLAKVNAAIAALPEPIKSAATIEWEYSGTVKRHNGFVEQLAPVLGLKSEQLDKLFIAGGAL